MIIQNPKPRIQNRKARAFTLLEVAIVLSLLGLLALFAWPAMSNRMRASELPESANRLRSMLLMARSGAVLEHRRVRVRFIEGEQHPIIEIERDPFRNPGIFEEVIAAWNEEPALLGDVQVHSISLGRPEFLKPLAEEVDPDTDASEAATAEPGETEFGETTDETLALRTTVEEDEDPNRPSILFEADGSSDWAWLVVARHPPGELIDDDIEQRWLIIDGRTGLISVRDALTEEELADPDFYVQREKLELPLDDADLTRSGLQAGAGGGGAGQFEGDFNSGSFDPGSFGQDAGGFGSGFEAGMESHGGGRAGQSGRMDPGRKRDQGGMLADPTDVPEQPQGESDGFQAATLEELQQKLDASDLSDEEKKQILEAFESDEKSR